MSSSDDIESIIKKIRQDVGKDVIGQLKKTMEKDNRNYLYRASDGFNLTNDAEMIINQVAHYMKVDLGSEPFTPNYNELRDWVKFSGKVELEYGTEEEISKKTTEIYNAIQKHGLRGSRITLRVLKSIENNSQR